MRSLFPFACAGLIVTGASLAQDRSVTPTPIKANGSATLQDASTTPSALPRGTVVQVPGANNAPFTQNGLTPGQPAGLGGGMNVPAGGGATIWDNGIADGINGYSNATVAAFGARRTLLDDFNLPSGGTVGCVEWTSVHGNGEPAGFGTSAEFDLWSDSSGSPGASFATANVTTYSEIETGGVFFSRPEIAHTALIDPIALGAGTYWLEGTVVAPGNNFWLTSGGGAVQLSECWVNYDDLGGLQPGSVVFGAISDINFTLSEGGPPPPPSCADDLLHDNGVADGINGYSNATVDAFGARRTLLDDFDVAAGKINDVTCISWTHVHGNGEPAGFGTDAEFDFRNDAAGTPGAVIATANVTSYSETETGGIFFSRPEISSVAEFDPVNLLEGTYWIEGTVVAPGNNFWLTSGGGAVQGSECWVNYDDLGGLQPGSVVFGAIADINFEAHGIESDVPPPAVCKLYDNGAADGVNGYSNIAQPAGSGLRRTVLDDFNVPAGEIWTLGGMCWTSVHGNGEPEGLGIGAEFDFRDDAAGTPGAVISTATVTAYSESETGGVFFSRPEIASVAEFDAIALGTGTYWWDGTIVTQAFANNFWLTAAQQGNECWVNYEDLGGLQSGTTAFGAPSDMNFQISANRLGTYYCDALANSTGGTGVIQASGSLTVGDKNMLILACGLPANENGYLLNSMNTGDFLINNSGRLCLGDGKGRHTKQAGNSGAAGQVTTFLDLDALPRSGPPFSQAVLPGDTWYFQFWHRDGNASNFTDAVCVTFN